MPSPTRTFLVGVLQLLGTISVGRAARDLGFKDDTDLTSFVTRPEIKAPIFTVTYKDEEKVTPGYWFVYAKVLQQEHPAKYYQPCSTGPAIYDNDGELVWSGACLLKNQNACDFRAFTDANGDEHLSLILKGYLDDMGQKAVIMDTSFDLERARNVSAKTLDFDFNMHEYKVIDQGRRALYITYKPAYVALDGIDTKLDVGWVSNVGFREIDLETEETIFEWYSLDNDQVFIWETNAPVDNAALQGPHPFSWNWFHPNSVDKSPEGDYLISGRFVDTIYKISGTTGKVLWRLGGKFSDFTLEGFTFSKQHDAQFLGRDPRTGEETISFFDNAQAVYMDGTDSTATAGVSSLYVVRLDPRDMTARVANRIDRPDGGITALRGNYQHLPNGGGVGAWSGNAYVSEHAPRPDNRVVFEGHFASERFVTYRMYKHAFTGRPTEPPALKVVVYGDAPETSTTVWYVSWNGATEVETWRFRRGGGGGEEGGPVGEVVGEKRRTGFETTFQSDGAEDEVVCVEALARNGSVIGRSEGVTAVLPYEWSSGGLVRAQTPPGGRQEVMMTYYDKNEL